MSKRIEDYAIIGDCQTGALIDKRGSLDWLCFPRFDSEACFAALLGTEDHGRWLLTPDTKVRNVKRCYLEDTLVLETVYTTHTGTVAVIDFMSLSGEALDVVRIVEGRKGSVPMKMDVRVRLDTGSMKPWVRKVGDGVVSVAGPEALHLHSQVEVEIVDSSAMTEFTVSEGERFSFVLTFFESHRSEPRPVDPEEGLETTCRWWREWASQCKYDGPYREAVVRSLITLKALTYEPTGGLIAALTTSLPEAIGGGRNWDYRYCWLRDAALTLNALMLAGYTQEACAWRDWLLRAVGGDPTRVQPIYSVSGARRMEEYNADWLPGFCESRPVRLGNAASNQLQLDSYGELMDAFHSAREKGVSPEKHAWELQCEFLKYLETNWTKPDHGIWEVRGEPHQFTHSKIMIWVAFDRGVKAIENFNLEGPLEKWKELRETIHQDVCEKGFSAKRNAFVQTYENEALDASLLMIPSVGFLPIEEPRVRSTIEAIQRELTVDGLVRRYDTKESADPDQSEEGAFLLCTFWLAGCLSMMGRHDEAQDLYERLLDLRNDVGLLAEEFDPKERRFLGNFPQAFSQVAIINTAFKLLRAKPDA